ncbi:hypothetical protein FRC14_007981 [Serendipita sp. 396]|nr:hypothetical protein FRC14_007981 [Serendipita sp. 396]KAG8771564.1 hypothetical protein FRC15_003344 [Serendipita sp. 397]KAG8780551.1 hypothetical protein FRC16_003108 [Serendipita sp. 398]KAG8811563.1 hypothetical protein FRC18_003411 [Serendipita sp. 400]KAG8845326.1 hypothetical protein FRC20_003251 [Serendipita sp. 405]
MDNIRVSVKGYSARWNSEAMLPASLGALTLLGEEDGMRLQCAASSHNHKGCHVQQGINISHEDVGLFLQTEAFPSSQFLNSPVSPSPLQALPLSQRFIMKLIAPFAALLVLCASTMASPMPNPDPVPEPVPEPIPELGSSPNLPATIAKRDGNWAECYEHNTGNGIDFTINTWGTWDNDWGSGFLDNLRGQCGQIWNWQFNYYGDMGQAKFTLVWWIPAHCVENAIWLASNPTGAIWGVSCQST